MLLIPFFQIPSLPPGANFAIHPFGVLVATGILSGAALTIRRGLRLGLQDEMLRTMIFWSVATGLVMAHVLDVLIYQDHGGDLKRLLVAIIDVRSGLSSMAGFAGAVLGLWLFCRRYQQDMLAHADSLAFGLALGWFFGRMGCFVAHDHPGRLVHPGDFLYPLGVDYPQLIGQPIEGWIRTDPSYRRIDLGFLEVVISAILTTFYFVMERFKPRKGFFVAAIATYYGPIRFFLDYLRVNESEWRGADPRTFGLTPAQYAAIVVTLLGIYLCVKVARRQPVEYPSQ